MNKDLEKFISIAIARGVAEEQGDSKKNNKCYKKLKEISSHLKESGRSYELTELLSHDNAYVRLSAAIYTLTISPIESERVLLELTSIKGNFVGIIAKWTLEEWRKGNFIP